MPCYLFYMSSMLKLKIYTFNLIENDGIVRNSINIFSQKVFNCNLLHILIEKY